MLGEKHYTAWVVDGWMSLEQWCDDIDRGNPEGSRKVKFVYNRTITKCYLYRKLSQTLTAIATVLPPTN